MLGGTLCPNHMLVAAMLEVGTNKHTRRRLLLNHILPDQARNLPRIDLSVLLRRRRRGRRRRKRRKRTLLLNEVGQLVETERRAGLMGCHLLCRTGRRRHPMKLMEKEVSRQALLSSDGRSLIR